MEWFEYVIIAAAIFLVILPIILSFKNKKKGKTSCGCNCSCCALHDSCCKNLKGYLEEIREEKKKEAEKVSNVMISDHQ